MVMPAPIDIRPVPEPSPNRPDDRLWRSGALPQVGHHEAVACRRCKAVLSVPEAIIDVDGRGARRHVVNPHGWLYEVVTLHTAPGAMAVGDASGEHTWFAGYAWRLARCGCCGQHVGWRFHKVGPAAGVGGFTGLIRTAVIGL